MKRQAIIYVDDEAVILLALKQELLRHFQGRYIIETATSVAEAELLLATLDAEGVEVALVLSDWLMPGTRGDEFLIDLHARRPEIKAILVTGQANEDAIQRTIEEAKLVACVRKPWNMTAFLEVLDRCVEDKTYVGGCLCR